MIRPLLSLLLVFLVAGTAVEAAETDRDGSASQPSARLLAAARVRNTAAVRQALSQGAALEARGVDGATALIVASQVGADEIALLLLERRQSLRLTRRFTALMQASARGHTAIARALLAKGMEPDVRNESGVAALHLAAGSGRLPIVRLLLEQQADPNLRSKSGQTPLMLAALNGKTRIAEVLLEHGAREDERSDDGQTALMYAASAGRTYTVGALLAAGADANAVDDTKQSARDLATAQKHGDIANLLRAMESETKPADATPGVSAGPSDFVIGQPSTSTLISALLAKGADVNARSVEGKTALLLAAEKGRSETVRKLLANGAEVDAQDAAGQTALERAAKEGHRDVGSICSAGATCRAPIPRCCCRSCAPRTTCSWTRRARATRSSCCR
jgi:ankyrin repeat protein